MVDTSARPQTQTIDAPAPPPARPAGPPPDSAARYFLYSAVFWLIVPIFAGLAMAIFLYEPHVQNLTPEALKPYLNFGRLRPMHVNVAIYGWLSMIYAGSMLYYRETADGQLLEEGITEAGALSSWIAAATSYSVHGLPLLPMYIYYSMFGFQRVGDLIWAAADQRSRGFLFGATAGRTTLGGEGLQHQDGSSLLVASTVPNCIAYDPAYAYELAVIIQDGLRRMYAEQEDVYYYITVMNENYAHPQMPEDAEEGVLKGMYLLREGKAKKNQPKVQLLGSGTILREVVAGAELLEREFGIAADIWSVTSFTELRRDGLSVERWNMLHPEQPPRVSYVEQCMKDRTGPVVAATDYMKIFADQIRAFLPGADYIVLGTDGFGRSDTRAKLREFFEVNRYFVAVASLRALADEGAIPASKVAEAIKRYGINPDKPNPALV